jgi:FAD dependent oxidoreductase TIGR03364
MYRLARRSREIWLEVLRDAGLWHDPCGSLHLAYHDDEAAVLREFAGEASDERPCEVLTAAEVTRRFPAIRTDGLRAGLRSDIEVTVDPRQVIAELPHWLQRAFGVEFHFGTTALRYDSPTLVTTGGEFAARRLVVCTGADFRELAPQAFAASGLVPCKLQMMRSQPYGDRFRVGAMLAAGLTLRHYPAFAACPSLPALARRIETEYAEYMKYGIHVLVSQNVAGEVIIGDSHEYGDAIEPFDKSRIDDLIIDYLRRFVSIPALAIAARWHGIYVKHPTEPYVVARPSPEVLAVTGVGGAGMTLSFGLAEQLVSDFLGERG